MSMWEILQQTCCFDRLRSLVTSLRRDDTHHFPSLTIPNLNYNLFSFFLHLSPLHGTTYSLSTFLLLRFFFVLRLFCVQHLSVIVFLRFEKDFSNLRKTFFEPSKLSITCKWRVRRLLVTIVSLACDDSDTCKWHIFSKAPQRYDKPSIFPNLRCLEFSAFRQKTARKCYFFFILTLRCDSSKMMTMTKANINP